MVSLLKISPIFVLAGLMLSGVDILLAAPLATLVAGILAMALGRFTFRQVHDAAVENAKQFMVIFFILMLSFALAEVFMASGVGAAIILVAMKLGLTGKTVAMAGLLVTAALSTATGTSWGTFAACIPVFLWLSHIVGGDPVLTMAAIAGGSCFGDNIGLISDTTVLSSGIQNVDVIDRVRHQGVWSLLCLGAGAVVFYLVAAAMGLADTTGNAKAAIDAIPKDVWAVLAEKRASAVALLDQVRNGVSLLMLVPLLIVLGMAAAGVSTVPCLGAGILAGLVAGELAGTLTIKAFGDLVYRGFADAGAWPIAMTMWTGAFGGIMRLMDAFDPIAKGILSLVRNVRQLLFSNGVLCLLCNAALGDCTGQIVTVGPIIREMVDGNVKGSEKDLYTLRLRNATMSDAFGVLGSQLIPWHGYVIFFTGMSMAVYPLYKFTPMQLVLNNYFCLISVVSMMVLTLTGWDRFVPLFRLPREPEVELIRS